MYELFTAAGPHLTAPWSTDDTKDHRDEHSRIKEALRFPAAVRRPKRDTQRFSLARCAWCCAAWKSTLIDASQARANCSKRLRRAKRAKRCRRQRGQLASWPRSEARPGADAEMDALFREVRKLLAGKSYDQVIDKLDIHRPAEWTVVNLLGARTLRVLGQAYLARGEFVQGRDCLEQLRMAQQEQSLLSPADYAAALSDLCKCYRGLGQAELAQSCQEEARRLL